MSVYAAINREVGYFGHFPCFYSDRYICVREDEHLLLGQNEEPVPPLACSFSSVNPYLVAVVDEDGGILLFDVMKQGAERLVKEWQGHSNAIFDVAWVPGDSSHLVTGSGDQTITLWDTEREQKLVVMKGHKSSVKTIRFLPLSNAVLASGSRDGRILIWDMRVSKKGNALGPVNVISNVHPATASSSQAKRLSDKDPQHSVTAVIFQDETTLISAGSADGKIQLWDLRKNYSSLKTNPIPKQTIPYAGKNVRNHGYSSLVLDSSRTRLFANCLDSVIYEFNLSSVCTNAVSQFRGHKNSTFYIRSSISVDNRYLLTGSSDANAYIYAVDEPFRPPSVLQGHGEEVSSGQWHPCDPGVLVTFSDDCRFRTWRFKNEAYQCSKHNEVGYAYLHEPVLKTRDLFSPLKKSNLHANTSVLSPSAKLAIARLNNPASLSFKLFKQSAKKRSSLPLSIASGLPTPKKITVTPLKVNKENINSSAMQVSVAKRRLYDEMEPVDVCGKKLKSDGFTSDMTTVIPLGSESTPTKKKTKKYCPLLENIPNLVLDGRNSQATTSPAEQASSFSTPQTNWLLKLSSRRKQLAEINVTVADSSSCTVLRDSTKALASPNNACEAAVRSKSTCISIDRTIEKPSPLQLVSAHRDNKMPVNTDDKTLVNVDSKMPVNVDNKTPVNVDNKMPMNLNNKTPVNVDNKTPVNVDNKTPLNVDNKTPVNIDNKTPVNVDNKTPVHSKLKTEISGNSANKPSSNSQKPKVTSAGKKTKLSSEKPSANILTYFRPEASQ